MSNGRHHRCSDLLENLWVMVYGCYFCTLHSTHLKTVASQAMALCGSILLQQHIYPNGKKLCVWLAGWLECKAV